MNRTLEILLVEDNLLNQKVVVYNLKKENYNVIAVADGLEAFNEIKKREFDLILMDIMLPVMDGFEATSAIRKYEKEKGREKQVQIIALTANTLNNDRIKCIKAGMDEFLAKPFSASQLISIIKKVIKKQ